MRVLGTCSVGSSPAILNIAERQLKGTLSSSPLWKWVVSVYRKIKLSVSVTLDDIRNLKSCLVFAYPS